RHDDRAHPVDVGNATGSAGPCPRQIHDPARRPTHRLPGRANERLDRARPCGAARDRAHQDAAALAVAIPEFHARRPAGLRRPQTKTMLAGVTASGISRSAQQPPPAQQPTDIRTTISGEGGSPPRLAVPDFIAMSPDAETAATAKTIGQVLWDDLNYE